MDVCLGQGIHTSRSSHERALAGLSLRPFGEGVLLALLLGCVAGCQQTGGESSPDPEVKTIEVTSPTGVAMVLIPGGEFLMGSDTGGDESPRHRVVVSPLAMDKFEVSQRQFAELELPDPSHFKDSNRPVEQVRWIDAALFCNARSQAEGLAPAYDEVTFECDFEASGYRLPTEAEWEYAARAGSQDDFYFGNDPRKLTSYACYGGNSKQKTDPVGRKRPNGWGLHDMLGNVAEWCHDVYAADYYQLSPAEDPCGSAEGDRRVMRGGSWKSSAESCRVTARQGCLAGFTDAMFYGRHTRFPLRTASVGRGTAAAGRDEFGINHRRRGPFRLTVQRDSRGSEPPRHAVSHLAVSAVLPHLLHGLPAAAQDAVLAALAACRRPTSSTAGGTRSTCC